MRDIKDKMSKNSGTEGERGIADFITLIRGRSALCFCLNECDILVLYKTQWNCAGPGGLTPSDTGHSE